MPSPLQSIYEIEKLSAAVDHAQFYTGACAMGDLQAIRMLTRDLRIAVMALLNAEDVVKLRLMDDPEEYTDAEKLEALCQLFDAADAMKAEPKSAFSLAGRP